MRLRLPRSAYRCLAAVLLGGCSSTDVPPTGDIALDLKHVDPRFRVGAARAAVEVGDMEPAREAEVLSLLIENLSDDDPAVRMWTGIALRKITRQDFDFKPHGTPAEREEAVRRWIQWAESTRAEAASAVGARREGS